MNGTTVRTIPRSCRYTTAVLTDLSHQSKQAFQVASLIATVMVVGIHYKSDIPDTPFWSHSTWNELLQEFWFGGVSRVAVPMFSFVAGLFYFRSDDGTWSTYRKKFCQRCRTVAFPYFIVASVAMVCWLLAQSVKAGPTSLTWGEFLATWLLHPPSEQLWFLRDLMVLVAIAPLIRSATSTTRRSLIWMTLLSLGWILNIQPSPVIAGWHLLHIETLLFFSIGCIASRHNWTINQIVSAPNSTCIALCSAWLALVAIRVWMRPDFDIWYTDVYGLTDLLVHQASIFLGCLALLSLSGRFTATWLQRCSGASFFVFLIHEFPLRAAVEKVVDRFMEPAFSCWVVVPLVVVGCYWFGVWVSDRFPSAVGVLTGGRTPKRATKIVSGATS